MKDNLQKAILLLGPTASGKTPLGNVLSIRGVNGQRCVHFDFGFQLRKIASTLEQNEPFNQDEVNDIRGVLEGGLLLENEQFCLAEKIFNTFLAGENVLAEDLVVLNGLPRHRGQAEGMIDIVDVETVVVLHCTTGNILCRIDNDAGGDRTARDDDHFELVKKKVAIYHKRTTPLIDYYQEQGTRIIHIEVTPLSDSGSLYSDFLSKYNNQPVNIR